MNTNRVSSISWRCYANDKAISLSRGAWTLLSSLFAGIWFVNAPHENKSRLDGPGVNTFPQALPRTVRGDVVLHKVDELSRFLCTDHCSLLASVEKRGVNELCSLQCNHFMSLFSPKLPKYAYRHSRKSVLLKWQNMSCHELLTGQQIRAYLISIWRKDDVL